MPTLSERKANAFVKVIVEGDAGIGKTSALVSLVKAGYRLHILDFDNLLGPLVSRIRETCPDKIGNVDYVALRDKIAGTQAGPVIQGAPKAIMDAMKLLDKWEDGSAPAQWGAQHVLVIDSLTRMSDAAINWGEFLTPKGGKSGERDGRAIIGEAQRIVSAVLDMVSSDAFATNVVVLAHVRYYEREDGTTKGYPIGPGEKIGPRIPGYFDAVLLAERSADGKTRQLRTDSTAMIELKNPVGASLPVVLPLDTGWATFFEKVKFPQGHVVPLPQAQRN